jgi:type IV pilus assembly protein PilA
MLKKYVKNQRGLTLIELLAVIVILGIIAAIAIPSIGGIINNSKMKAHQANALMILDAVKLYYLDHPEGENITTGTPMDTRNGMANQATVQRALVENGHYLDAIPNNPFTGAPYTTVSIVYQADGNHQITLGPTSDTNNANIFTNANKLQILNWDFRTTPFPATPATP